MLSRDILYLRGSSSSTAFIRVRWHRSMKSVILAGGPRKLATSCVESIFFWARYSIVRTTQYLAHKRTFRQDPAKATHKQPNARLRDRVRPRKSQVACPIGV